jgi:hypothetical protein
VISVRRARKVPGILKAAEPETGELIIPVTSVGSSEKGNAGKPYFCAKLCMSLTKQTRFVSLVLCSCSALTLSSTLPMSKKRAVVKDDVDMVFKVVEGVL